MGRTAIGAASALLIAIGVAAAQPPPLPPGNLPPVAEAKPSPDVPAVPPPAPTSCDDGARNPDWVDCHQGPAERVWFDGGFSYMWLKNGPQSFPLVTSGGAIAIGGSNLDFGTFNAGALDAGMWINDRHTLGLYAGGFITEQRSTISALASSAGGSPQIARPFIDALTFVPSALLVSSPPAISGSVVVAADARLYGADGGTLWNLFQTESVTINLLYGFRYLNLEENLSITQQSQQLTIAPTPPLGIADRFQTRNEFYGGQIGACGEYRFGSLAAGVASKVSLGTNHEVVGIIGQTSGIGGLNGIPGGLLAVPGGNAGRFINNRFVVVPEVGVTLGWQATQWLRCTIGYDFLYINDVVRPGSQIDPLVNTKLVPISPNFGSTSGPNFPMPTGKSDTFYAHGLQFAAELTY
jgi:hypothetical protein